MIAKVKKAAYRKSREEVCASLKNMWKVVKHTQNRASRQPCFPDIQKSDGGYATEPREKIEELKKVLLPVPYLVDLSDILYF